jgi:hypothetical protein
VVNDKSRQLYPWERVAGLISHGVSKFFVVLIRPRVRYPMGSLDFSLTSSGRTMALGLTQPLTEMSSYQEYLLGREGGGWGEDGRCLGLKTLPPLCADYLEILGASTSWRPRACRALTLLVTSP